ncbi:MAG: outer membrane protein assembly factor BamA [Elusimicrobia bacterium CG08_land_8_20_14_0_20_59_10]|nr:MAG: outer membrane protein assembly factor BamA [Elusimicrobia bacterium CG08_land_8_20_14_0_20_59_10]
MKALFRFSALLLCLCIPSFLTARAEAPSSTTVSAAPPTAQAAVPASLAAPAALTPAALSTAPVFSAMPGMVTGDPDRETLGQGPWEVAETAVKGNRNLKPKVVLKTGKAKKGQLYMQGYVSQDIEAIMGLGSLEKVSVDIEELDGKAVSKKLAQVAGSTRPARITYLVMEKPAVKKITVKGAKGLSKSSVKNEMALKEKDFFDELKIREDLIKITDKYHEKGYIDAKADYEVRHDTAASLCYLTINVTEGKKAKIYAVEFTGAAAYKTRKLTRKMTNRPKKIYAPKELDSDLKALETFYTNSGYADFKVTGSSATFNEDRSSVTLRISVSEGIRQRFGATFFSGNSVYMPGDFEPDLAYRRGKLYKQETFDDTLRAIQDRYADKGYLKAAIVPDKVLNEKTGQTDITFIITENTQIYVDHIDIEGNKATKTYVLKREVTQKEGEVFSSSKIRRSQEKIFNLGFIDDVAPVINPTPDPDKVDLVFDVTEGKPGMLTAGAGISSTDGLVGTVSLSHMNMFGRAQRLSLSWNFGKRVQDYYLSWSTPWIGNHPTRLGADIFNTRHYKPYRSTISAYTERRTGGKITVAPRFGNDKYHLTTSYTYEKIRIYEIDNIYSSELIPGTSVTSSIYVEFARDTRDNIWDPTRGCRTSLGVELAGGPLQGDVNFYKPTFSHSYNLKLFSIDDYPFVLAVGNRMGFVSHFGDTKRVPVYERYFLGGAETVRGYSNNGQVGPASGGKVYDVLNIEFKIPLARERRRTIVQWAFFFDVGNSWEHFNTVSGRFGSGTRDLKTGAGFGIRFTTPAFPIRLDWGYGFNHKSGEQRSDIYFTLGNLF